LLLIVHIKEETHLLIVSYIIRAKCSIFPMMEGTCLWFLGVCWSDSWH